LTHKGRLPAEEKIRLVEAYLSGTMGMRAIEREYGLDHSTFPQWVRLYRVRGPEGLIPSTHNRKYPAEIKLRAVKDYLSGVGSQRDICTKYDISSKVMLSQWIKRYSVHGDFKQPNSGGLIYMSKGRKTTHEERIEIVSHCIATNKNYGQTVEQYGVSYQQIYGWVRKYETNGVDGLCDRRGKRKDEASMSEFEKLRAQLKLKEAENLRLRMENDLLKKLDALERPARKSQ